MARKSNKKLKIGGIFNRGKGTPYSFRYTNSDGVRVNISLHTKDREEALRLADEHCRKMLSAKTIDEIEVHVKQHKRLEAPQVKIYLESGWQEYCVHPDRATPATINEQLQYEADFKAFLNFLDKPLMLVTDVTHQHAVDFANHLRQGGIAVATHNRKINRLRKIFSVLAKLCACRNPFEGKDLRRSSREENHLSTHRRAFTKEQEYQLLEVIKNPEYRLKDREEMLVLFLLGMFTGQRQKDCVLLQWHNVKLDTKKIVLKQYKTGRSVTIPIADELLEGLENALKWKTGDDDSYVLPNIAMRYSKKSPSGKTVGANSLDHCIGKIIEQIGLETSRSVPGRNQKITVYGFHSFRHSFVSLCAEANVAPSVVKSIVGANTEIIDEHYTHVGLDQQKDALDKAFNLESKTSASRVQEAIDFIKALSPEQMTPELTRTLSILQD